MESRYYDTTPVYCEDCGWHGRVMDCIHDYTPVAPDDVEPCDFCPECGGSNLVDSQLVGG